MDWFQYTCALVYNKATKKCDTKWSFDCYDTSIANATAGTNYLYILQPFDGGIGKEFSFIKLSYDTGKVEGAIDLKGFEPIPGELRYKIDNMIVSQDGSTAYIQKIDSHPIFAFDISKV